MLDREVERAIESSGSDSSELSVAGIFAGRLAINNERSKPDEPNPSRRCVSRFACAKTWRVMLPKGLGGGQWYFNDSDYGGEEAALKEALYYRDERFEVTGLSLMARLHTVPKPRSLCPPLCIYRVVTKGRQYIRGTWMVTQAGRPTQKVVARSVALHGYEKALSQVHDIVGREVQAETRRLERAELEGRLAEGDGILGSRRRR